ncbi:hypothetical protein ABLE91_26430 [Aquabacter sp. CN5-332]|uniref:hypothetical protein n=1 Tax=Aquabacter sp. CN5-332 TaxID=3156608 RepID=UPI0032B3B286
MIPAIGPVGKSDEPSIPVIKPVADPVRTAQAASVAVAPPAPVRISGEDINVDDFIYTSTVKTIVPAMGPGSVTIPGIGVFPGLVDQGYSNSEVKYEIRIGGVLVARIYENGVAMTASGFDLSRLGFPSPEEDGMTGSQKADHRLARLSSYFSTLDVAFDIVDKGGNQVTLNWDGKPVVSRPDFTAAPSDDAAKVDG